MYAVVSNFDVVICAHKARARRYAKTLRYGAGSTHWVPDQILVDPAHFCREFGSGAILYYLAPGQPAQKWAASPTEWRKIPSYR